DYCLPVCVLRCTNGSPAACAWLSRVSRCGDGGGFTLGAMIRSLSLVCAAFAIACVVSADRSAKAFALHLTDRSAKASAERLPAEPSAKASAERSAGQTAHFPD